MRKTKLGANEVEKEGEKKRKRRGKEGERGKEEGKRRREKKRGKEEGKRRGEKGNHRKCIRNSENAFRRARRSPAHIFGSEKRIGTTQRGFVTMSLS
jgi:hypothetical protein